MTYRMKSICRGIGIIGWLAWIVLGVSGVVAGENQLSLADASGAAEPTPATEAASAPCAETPAPEAASTEWPPGLLQQGLDTIGLGKPMQDLGLRAYGYVETGMTFKMHGPLPRRQGLPLRGFESRRVGNVRLHQLMFTLDRPVDTSKSFDMGGRVDFLYGSDATLIHQLRMFDTNQTHHDVNYEIPQGYGEMWFKTGPDGQGFDIIFGKWFTTIGGEVFSAPGNYLYSRSLLYVFAEPVSHTGLKIAYNFDSLNSIQNRIWHRTVRP